MSKAILPVDFCTLCGERLKDNLVITRKAHDKINHEKELKKQKSSFKVLVVVLGILILGGVLILFNPSIFYSLMSGSLKILVTKINPDLGSSLNIINPSDYTACQTNVLKLKQSIYAKQILSGQDVDTMNNLIKNCNLDFSTYEMSSSILTDKALAPITTISKP